MYEECIERLIEHEAEPSALLGLEMHSEYTISGNIREYTGALTGLVFVCGDVRNGGQRGSSCKLASWRESQRLF